MADNKFRYGKCHTDTNKTGQEIRSDFPRTDYILNPEVRPQVAEALAALGLPFPEEDRIFRGTYHDLLFLDSHGVVVRIGPMEMDYLVNPALLQPLGWIDGIARDADNTRISLAIYPGIEQFNPQLAGETYGLDDLQEFMERSGQNSDDMSARNTGVIRIRRDGHDVRVPVVLDVDNIMVGAGSRSSYLRRGTMDMWREDMLPSRALQDALTSVSPVVKLCEDLVDAFAVHQPLRHMYWRAWRDADGKALDMPEPAQMAAFWARCERALCAPERVILHEWGVRKGTDGAPVWAKFEHVIDNMSLYRAWTGAAADKVPKFTGSRAGWTDILQTIADDPAKLANVDQTLAQNREFASLAVQMNKHCIAYLEPALRADKDFIDALPLEPLEKVMCMDDALRDNPDVLLPYITIDDTVFGAASPRLQRDSAFLGRCLEMNSKVARYLPPSDVSLALDALRRAPHVYKYLPDEIKDNRAFKLEAAALGTMLCYMSTEDRRYPDVVRAALRANPDEIIEVDDSLGHDKEFIKEFLKSAPWKTRDMVFYRIPGGDEYAFDLVKERIVKPEHLPQDFQRNVNFMARVARLPHITPNDIPTEMACTEEFKRRAEMPEWAPETVVDFDEKGAPIVERSGLRYVWARNIRYDEAYETGDGRVRLTEHDTLIVRDAVTGPAKEDIKGLIGIYIRRH
jgi:hypothetical protein